MHIFSDTKSIERELRRQYRENALLYGAADTCFSCIYIWNKYNFSFSNVSPRFIWFYFLMTIGLWIPYLAVSLVFMRRYKRSIDFWSSKEQPSDEDMGAVFFGFY